MLIISGDETVHQGKSFYEVSLMCNIYEGALVRVLRRLDDMMRELVTAAQWREVISNDELATKVQSARVKLQHGVVFAPSFVGTGFVISISVLGAVVLQESPLAGTAKF
eukprot:6463473-Amphidinium_carterae.1